MKNEKGLTLIELVVSVAVLSILIVPFFGIFTNAAKLDIRSKNDMTANYLAQQIVAEVKNNPGIFDEEEDDDWTTEDSIDLGALFTSTYNGFSAKITLNPTVGLLASNGKENEMLQNDYDVDFNIEWNKDDKSFFYIWEDIPFEETIDDTSSNFEFIVEECNGCDDCSPYEDLYSAKYYPGEWNGPYDYHVAIKVDNSNYWVTIPFNVNADDPVIGIKLLASDISNGSNKVTIDNKTDITIKVFTSDDADKVDIEKKNNNDSSIELDPPISGSDDESHQLQNLTVEVTGYDPISEENRVLTKIITTVK
jgi:prepilin-type N-terminal cleavage/methylation domain-containing protein